MTTVLDILNAAMVERQGKLSVIQNDRNIELGERAKKDREVYKDKLAYEIAEIKSAIEQFNSSEGI